MVGRWYTVPVNIEQVKEELGLNGDYEEYAIHDYELPFDIGEYESIERINNIYHQLEDADEDILADLEDLMWEFDSIEELIERIEDLVFYKGFDTLEDLAIDYVEQGLMGEVPPALQYYIDYAAIARDMAIEGRYVTTDNGIWEIVS